MEGPRAGRRTIGEVAGHEINLEIEGVQDKKISRGEICVGGGGGLPISPKLTY